jgi:hypothetical protein
MTDSLKDVKNLRCVRDDGMAVLLMFVILSPKDVTIEEGRAASKSPH